MSGGDIPDRAYQLARLALVLASMAIAGLAALAIYCVGGDASTITRVVADVAP